MLNCQWMKYVTVLGAEATQIPAFTEAHFVSDLINVSLLAEQGAQTQNKAVNSIF